MDMPIPLAVFLAILFIIFAHFFIYNYMLHRAKSYYDKLIVARFDLAKLDIPTGTSDKELKAIFRQGWKHHLKERVEARLKHEKDPSFGKPVWLSIFAKRGHLRHWAILTHGHKYELRRTRPSSEVNLDIPPEAQYRVELEANPSPKQHQSGLGRRLVGIILGRLSFLGLKQNWEVNEEKIHDISDNFGFRKHYKSEIKKHNSYDQIIAEREEALRAGHNPEVHHQQYGNLFILHIGWTAKSKQEVDSACERVGDSFGKYNVVFRNCQHFVRELAKEIVTLQGQDWEWFMHLPLRPYQYRAPETIKPPAGAVLLAIEKMKEGWEDDPEWQAVADEQRRKLTKFVDGLQPEFQKANKFVSNFSKGRNGGGSHSGGGDTDGNESGLDEGGGGGFCEGSSSSDSCDSSNSSSDSSSSDSSGGCSSGG